jgi:hypothetical protein
MAKEYKEGIFDLQKGEYDEELLGLIVDDQSLWHRRIKGIVQIGVPFALLVILGFILYIQQTKDPEDISRILTYQQYISQRQKLGKKIASARDEPYLLKKVVEESIELAGLHVQPDNLSRPTYDGSANYHEKYLAILDALEGLLILDLEGGIDQSNPVDAQWFSKQLETIGLLQLVFYEDGVQRSIPLLKQSFLRETIQAEQERGSSDTLYIQELEADLKQLETSESFTLAAPAYMLGRWFRYQNDITQAKRAFEVGRKFVEGYRIGSFFYSGKRPKTIDALWAEYVGCLESLSELCFKDKSFRQARSYLLRAFNTPSEGISLQLTENINEQLKVVGIQILSLKHDIKVLKLAINSPMELQSFPEFSFAEQVIDWSSMIKLLKNGAYSTEKEPLRRLWNILSPKTKESIEVYIPTIPLDIESRENIIFSLNTLIKDPDFYKRVSFEPSQLTEKAQNIKIKSENEQITSDETLFLNRDILEAALEGAVKNGFVLSDGSRISSSLNPDQLELLIGLYEDELRLKNIPENRKQELAALIDQIYSNDIQARLADLQTVLVDRKRYWNDEIRKAENEFDRERQFLKQFQSKISELENQDIVDITELRNLQLQEELSRNRQLQSDLKRKEALNHSLLLDKQLNQVTAGLRQQLAEEEARLAQLLDRQHDLRSKSLEQQEPILDQVTRQINLHKKYLELLVGLRNNDGDATIQDLNKKRLQLDNHIFAIKNRLELLTGNQREKAQLELGLLEEQYERVVEELDSLFQPLRGIVKEIIVEEETIWKAEEVLHATQKEITHLIGESGVAGEIKRKSTKRASLLLTKDASLIEDASLDLEIATLNKSIAQDHAQLGVLIQKREAAQATLETFYPNLTGSQVLLINGNLEPLKTYLYQQKQLFDEYSQLKNESDLLKNMLLQQKIIEENLEFISLSLLENEILSSPQVNELTRYMRAIIQAKNKLSQGKYLFRTLGEQSFVQQKLNSVDARGIELDVLEMFQMEQSIGINIQEYREAFDERDDIVQQLEVALIEKKELQSQQLEAARSNDQVMVDTLIPKISEIEDIIRNLSERQLTINKKLRSLATEFNSRKERIADYIKEQDPIFQALEEKIQLLQNQISSRSQELNIVSENLFDTALKIDKKVRTLEIGDLSNIDELIIHEQKTLTSLMDIRDLKRKERYYRVKALWLIGKSFYEQSRLESYDQLLLSHTISNEILEDESRSAKVLYQEFDENYVYSEELFGNLSQEDENEANFQSWINFLEQNTQRIFNIELTKYGQDQVELEGVNLSLGIGNKEDIETFILRSKFINAKIYLTRALRFHTKTELEIQKNPQAQNELEKARAAFIAFMDFASTTRYVSKSKFTEETFGSQEFPERRRMTIKLVDDAQTYLGIIATLRGEYEEAIEYYQNLLETVASRAKVASNGSIQASTEPYEQMKVGNIENYEYQVVLDPYYISLLSLEPLAHEVLFRMARNYQLLANKELENSLRVTFKPKELESSKIKFKNYAQNAVAYYSQLVLTQAYSPFRRAALFYRADLYKELGLYNQAAQDLLSVINQPVNFPGSMEILSLGFEGDLTEIINPPLSVASLELGKIYFDQGNYFAALEAFSISRNSGENEQQVIQAKVEFAKSLIASKDWLRSEIFLTELIREGELATVENQAYYPPELIIELGKTKIELGAFEEGFQTLKEVFKIAPFFLLKENTLDLDNSYGMELLESDFRDAIRPLAIACYEIGNLLIKQSNYPLAREYFRKSERLFRMVPWKGDRIFQTKTKEEFQRYRQQSILESQWAILKTESQEVLQSSMANFKRVVNDQNALQISMGAEDMIAEVDLALKQVNDQKEQITLLLNRISLFYEIEHKKLPEVIAQEAINRKKSEILARGGEETLKYTALNNIREQVLLLQEAPAMNFLQALIEGFSKGSLENMYLNTFVMKDLPFLRLTEEDRRQMIPLNDNLQNLLIVKDPEKKLNGINSRLLQWVDYELSLTGLDDLFIPVSPEAAILVDVALSQASFLAILDSREDYQKLLEIAEKYIDLENKFPNAEVALDKIWQIVEIAALVSEDRVNWPKVELFNRYLLTNEKKHNFVVFGEESKRRAQLALAESLIELSKESFADLALSPNNDEKVKQEIKIDNYQKEASELLRQLIKAPGSDVSAIVTRIRANELLGEI